MALPLLPVPPKLVTFEEGVELCKILHAQLVDHGYYPALTGGLLYKPGRRKDIDIVIYRNRQKHDAFEMSDIQDLLQQCGVKVLETYGFVTKAEWNGFTVDLFNPETEIFFDAEGYCDES